MSPGGSDLLITVGGDISPLQDALDQIAPAAQEVGTQIDAAFSTAAQNGLERLNQGLQEIDQSANQVGDSLETAFSGSTAGTEQTDQNLQNLSRSLDETGQSASNAAGQVQQITPAVEGAGEAAEASESGFQGMAEQLVAFGEALAITEGLKEFGQEALDTYASVQKATIALTALTGSATQADQTIEQLKAMAVSDALSFPSLVAADQRLTAMGLSAQQVQTTLQAAADAAGATGQDFSMVSDAVARMALAGQAAGRQLATIGLSLQDLAKAMGPLGPGADAAAKDIQKAFASLTVDQRLQVLDTALGKFSGVAQQVAAGVAGQWQNVKTQFEFVMEGIGEALAPVISQLLSFASGTIVPAIQAMVNWFNQLPVPVKDAAVALGLVLAAAAPLAVAVGGFGLALSGLSAAVPAITAVGTAFAALATESIPAAFAAISNVVTAVSEGLVGALTTGETLLLSFAAAGVAVGAAFAIYEELKQVGQSISDLTATLSAAVPAWNNLKAAVSSLASAVGSELSAAWASLQTEIPSVTTSIQSLGGYLPSFSELWDELRTKVLNFTSALGALTGPLAAFNELVKSVTDALQMLTGVYPEMATAAGAAAGKVQAANDGLNDSLAQQAGGFQKLAPAQAAYTKAHQDSAAAVVQHATAVNQLVQAFDASSLGYSTATADAMRNSEAVKDLGMNVEVLTGAQKGLSSATVTGSDGLSYQIQVLRGTAGAAQTASSALGGLGQAAADAATEVVSAAQQMDNAINSVSQDAFQATQALDQFFNQGGTQGGSGIMQGVKPGDVIREATGGQLSSSTLGATYSNITVDPMAFWQQQLQLQQQQLQQLQQNQQATLQNTSAAVSSTAATVASTVATQASTAATAAAAASTDALTSATAAAGVITTNATAALVSSTAASVSATSNLAASVNAAATSINTAAVVVAQAAAVVAGALGPAGSNTTTQISLGPGVTATPISAGPGGSNTMLVATPSAFTPTAGTGVALTVNVTGNTITSQSQAQQLANVIMSTAIAKLRTQAGLKINV